MLVCLDAPNEATYEDAIYVLERNGYRLWAKMGKKRLKPGSYTLRPSILRVYWVEPTPELPSFHERLAEFRRNSVPQPKRRLI